MFTPGYGTCANVEQANHAKTTALKFANEIHVHMVMNRFLKINKPCESEKVFAKWMNEHLGSR
jgi:hypothetical protein